MGVSPDNEASHRKFIEKYGLKFNLIADTEKDILQAYGVWGGKNELRQGLYGGNPHNLRNRVKQGLLKKYSQKLTRKNIQIRLLTICRSN